MRAKYAARLQLFRRGASAAMAGSLGLPPLREPSGDDLAAYGRVFDEMRAKPAASWIEP